MHHFPKLLPYYKKHGYPFTCKKARQVPFFSTNKQYVICFQRLQFRLNMHRLYSVANLQADRMKQPFNWPRTFLNTAMLQRATV